MISDNPYEENLQASTHFFTSNTSFQENDFECQTEFETNKSFKIITTFFNFYVPLLGMVLIYTKIFFSIKSRSMSELTSNMTGSFRGSRKGNIFKNNQI